MAEISRIIGITGGSGSGKTYVLDRIRKEFPESKVAILSQDNYYRKRDDQHKDDRGHHNFDLPGAFLMNEFIDDLRKLRRGEKVERLEYTYNNTALTPGIIQTHPAPVVIAEGLFIMHLEEIRSLLDLAVYISVSDILKLKRRIVRDQVERNYPLEDVLYRYEHHVFPSYLQYIKPYKAHADLVINNNNSVDRALEVLLEYIRSRV